MRLLIYLLAMMTGFSAAEAARPVSAPAALGSAVTNVTVAVASVASVRQQGVSGIEPAIEALSEVLVLPASIISLIFSGSPITRHDLSRQ